MGLCEMEHDRTEASQAYDMGAQPETDSSLWVIA